MTQYDIGIQTFWNVPNYGTFAQAYALQKVLHKINGNKDVRQIAHLDKHHFDFYYNKKAYYRSFPVWKKVFWKSLFMKKNQISKKEEVFFKAYELIPHTKLFDCKSGKRIFFNKIFLGSDIIWDYSIEVFNNDPLLFGSGFDSEINSYAASFGTVNVNAEIPEYVRTSIMNMKHVSVRDKKSAEIVSKITGKTPEIVLDPAWLWDFDADADIEKPEEEDYILVYGQDFTDQFINNLVLYASKIGKQIIALDCNEDHYDWCDKMISQEDLSPLKWIGYFKYAFAVATSTFHGITFSLIFNKKLAFCKTDFIMAKIDEFLKEIHLFELYNQDCDDVEGMFEHKFDFVSINNVIDKKRKKSIEFLKKACDIENGEE